MDDRALFVSGVQMPPIYKTLTCASKAIDVDAGIYDVLISAETEDRDRDIVLAAGAQFENYMRNPVVLFAHNYSDLPIGKTLELEAVPGTGVKARMQFAPPGANPKADSVRALWAAGFLNAASIGFLPKTWENRPGPGGELAGEWGQYGRIYTSWELLEFSIVPVPANADALRLAAKALSDYGGTKRGRVLSAANEQRIRDAVAALGAVLAQLDEQSDGDAGKAAALEDCELADALSVLIQSMKEFLWQTKCSNR